MIEKAMKLLMEQYNKVKDLKHIGKPVTYALYATARKVEKLERRRDEGESQNSES